MGLEPTTTGITIRNSYIEIYRINVAFKLF